MARENEALKERIDILFKLGKSYVEANNIQLSHETLSSEDTNDSVSNTLPNKDNEIVEIVSDETANTSWNSNRLRGFRRKNHNVTFTDQVNTTDNSKNPENNEVTSQCPNEEVKSHHNVRSNPINNSPDQSNNSRPRYCHYFSNFGNCEFEEKSGLKCKFLHERAPMCNAGLNCSKMKCMYSHPKPPSTQSVRRNFLGNPVNFGPFMNPRQQGNSMNPWMHQLMPVWQHQNNLRN